MNKKSVGAQKTKQRILKVAFKLFAEKGYKHVTVDEIIKKARSSKGAFYNHFPSKDYRTGFFNNLSNSLD